MTDYLSVYRGMIELRGLTSHTIVSYSTYIRAYLDYADRILMKDPADVSWQELRDFVLWLKKQRSLNDRTINGCISQLRFFTLYVLHKPWDPYQLPMRRFDSYLPFVPSKEEVRIFISTIPDLRQKAMVSLLYSAGLRSSECRFLKYKDIERKSMRIHIEHSKNRSDRYAILSAAALDILTQYWFECGRPMNYLFHKKRSPDEPVDTNFLFRHIAAHEARLGWPKRLTCHSFRHAFGTHLYENGVDLLTIKELMGHKAIASTTIYVHLGSHGISSVKSPFDSFGGLSNG
jgi:integrase/recombinase XerD